MNLASLSVRYPRVLTVIMLVVATAGLIALNQLPRQEDPTLTWRLANVVTRRPGTSASDMESQVTDVLEQYLEEVDEVEHQYSVSRPGVSLIQIELDDSVTVAEPVWQQVRHKLDQAADELPGGLVGPELDDEIMGTYTFLIGLSSTSASYRQLKDHAEQLEQHIRYLPKTASTSLFGTQDEVIYIEPDPARLAAFGLSFESLAQTLRARNTRSPAGRLSVGGSELVFEASGEITTERQLDEIVVMVTGDGNTLRLADVATVRRTHRDPPAPLARVNGIPTVLLGVRARPNIRIDKFGRDIRDIVNAFRETLPDEVNCTITHDDAGYTTQRTSQLARMMLLSVALVFLSASVFMGWRAGTVVTATIPLAGLLVLALLMAFGVSLQQMSVMGIIMAFGLLVDDAVVVTEHIHRKSKGTSGILHAASEGTQELLTPLLITTLTTIAAFLPIYLLPGGTGEFVRAIPVTVALCLLAALAVAMTVIPALCAVMLSVASNEKQPVTDWFDRLLAWYEVSLRRIVRAPRRALAIVVIVMLGTASLGLTLRRDFFSPVQRDQFVIDVFGPQGSDVPNSLATVERIESLLKQEPSIVNVMSLVGRNAPLVFYNLTSQETFASHYAQLIVRVRGWQHTASAAGAVQSLLNEHVPNADCCVHILEHGAPFVAPFEVRIRGPSIPVLRELGRRSAHVLKQTPGVRNVRINYGNEAVRLLTDVNPQVSDQLGIDRQQVTDSLRQQFEGVQTGHVLEDDEQIEVTVRLPTQHRRCAADVSSMFFKAAPDAPFIPYSSIATIKPEWETASIYRRDGERTLTVVGYPRFGLTPAQVSRRFSAEIESLAETLPEGYSLELGGENEQRTEAESNLLRKGVYAVLLIVLLLMLEFKSLRLTGLILISLPLSMSGAMLGLWLTGWPLNFMAIMGMMILAGIVVNDAVILVDGFERRRGKQQPIDEAVVAGTLERTRHVVITTITTIAGFLPLALSASLLWPPLAIAIIGGLSMATLLTLIAIPAAFVLLCRDRFLDACIPQEY